MQIPGLSLLSPEAHRIQRRGGNIEFLNNFECEARVYVESAHLMFGTHEQKYRPYLQLKGELRAIIPTIMADEQGNETVMRLPAPIDTVTFEPKVGPSIDINYSFTTEELAELVKRGYFENDFRVPDAIHDTEYELQVVADMLIVHPEDEQDVPVVFAQVLNRSELDFDTERSGYDLYALFENVYEKRKHLSPEVQREADAEHGVNREQAENVFTQSELDEIHADVEAETRHDAPEPAAEPVVEVEVPEVEFELVAEPEVEPAPLAPLAAPVEHQPLDAEALYRERVLPATEAREHQFHRTSVVESVSTPVAAPAAQPTTEAEATTVEHESEVSEQARQAPISERLSEDEDSLPLDDVHPEDTMSM